MYEQSSLVGGRGSEEDTNLSTGREVNCAFFFKKRGLRCDLSPPRQPALGILFKKKKKVKTGKPQANSQTAHKVMFFCFVLLFFLQKAELDKVTLILLYQGLTAFYRSCWLCRHEKMKSRGGAQ